MQLEWRDTEIKEYLDHKVVSMMYCKKYTICAFKFVGALFNNMVDIYRYYTNINGCVNAIKMRFSTQRMQTLCPC